MPPYDAHRLWQIFQDALRRDPEERNEYVDRACANEPELREAVKALLDDHRDTQMHPRTGAVAEPVAHAGAIPPHNPRGLPRVVGSYVLREELGRGGMGVVYLADDTRLLRRVALKALAPEIAREPTSRERLRREARAAAALSHPGIATVFALEEIGDELFLACEYVPGPSLRRALKPGALPMRDVIHLSTQLARALAAAHALGIVHRDLKPENIIRTPAGTAKILDFGLAKMDNLTSSRVTQSGSVVGTPAYMSPEQATDQPLDFRTDIFSLGLVIFEMASGRNPFESTSLSATLALRLAPFDPPSLAAAVKGCPPELDRIVATCLRKDPRQRYETTERLVDDLTILDLGVTPTPVVVGPAQTPEPALGWWKTHLTTISIVHAAALYPAWHIETWLPDLLRLPFLLGLATAVAAAITLRMHLLFTLSFDPGELAAQYSRTSRWMRGCDVLFSGFLALGAVGIGSSHRVYAMLLAGVAVVTLVASLVIEPLTTRSAFRRSGRISGGIAT